MFHSFHSLLGEINHCLTYHINFVLLSIHALIIVQPLLAASETVTAIYKANTACSFHNYNLISNSVRCLFHCLSVTVNVVKESKLSYSEYVKCL